MITLAPTEKARRMVERWDGDRAICIKLANENLAIHRENNNAAGIKFWVAVIKTLLEQ